MEDASLTLDAPSAVRLFRRHEALVCLPESALRALQAEVTWTRVRRGEALWRAGEPATRLVLVARGLVALVATPARGRELILGLHAPVEGVDESAMFEGGAHRSDAFGFGGSTLVASIPRPAVLAALAGCAEASLNFTRVIARRHLEGERRLCGQTLPVERRIGQLLLDLAARFGDELDDGSMMIPLRLTRGELGAMVGTTVESTIRALSRWSRSGQVTSGENGIVLRDAAALRRELGLHDGDGPGDAPGPSGRAPSASG
ncbi:MAG: Crp/Fnr family transcriptional regulator [Polyangiales bacterium]